MKKLYNNSNNVKSLKKIFNTEQISFLHRQNAKHAKYSVSSISKALKVKAAGGCKALNQMKKDGFPIPSSRTCNRWLQNLSFDSGLLDDFFNFLAKKIPLMSESNRHCALSTDAIHLVPGYDIDQSTKKIIGGITFPHSEGDATCALVFMICGTRERWKETIAYYFTGNSVNGEQMKNVVVEIITKSEEIGLYVDSLTHDMGPDNTGMLNAFGIGVNLKSREITSSIVHPCNPNRRLYFYCDAPHIFKNLANGLRTHKTIKIPDFLVQKHALTANTVELKHIEYLHNFFNRNDIKFAPKLNEAALNPKSYQKMRVPNAYHFFSNEVSFS